LPKLEEAEAMAAIYQTAYPRIKSDITPNEMGDIYTPTPEEQRFALATSRERALLFWDYCLSSKPPSGWIGSSLIMQSCSPE
jgi:hypothetical protein